MTNEQTQTTEFDWSIDKEGFSRYSTDEQAHLEGLYEKTLSNIAEKEIVKGIVVGFTDKEVVLNIGFKSDGLIPRAEFRDLTELKVGDSVEVLLETKEDATGQLVLSRKKAISERAWENIVKANTNDEVVQGYVKSRTKGGLVVDVMGIDTFLPGSQIDTKPIKDYDIYVGQTMPFKVVKVNNIFKNVVISHKALIEEDIEAQKSDILSKLEKGQVLEGTVKNMTSFGVFIDLGGVD
ncbi:MAG: 30S ribosomal protein S1, partial [Bacteroidia bacterium]